MLIEYHPSHIN
jgi:hypothetical protein